VKERLMIAAFYGLLVVGVAAIILNALMQEIP